ncbi:MAG: KpsF/GutQ family sugar-phosphate isomerase [Planctomycetes bacterium]|nr:KpsF/GutQ family sugar-phosphate isomerase [Planctomycetota bacterium]
MDIEADLDSAREVLVTEGQAILDLAECLGEPLALAVNLVIETTGGEKKGRVVVTGMGKAGIVGQKISATLASTGTPSWSIHPAEAPHGDLGRITPDDVILALSKSGETAEISRLIGYVKRIGTRVISITSTKGSTLGRYSDIAIEIGDAPEACPLGLAPSTSTTVMLAVGDALALTVLKKRGLSREQFAGFHPGGALGRALIKVEEVMRTGEANVVVSPGDTIGDVISAISGVPNSSGRAGAACVVDGNCRLVGFFTDGDLRRSLQKHGGDLLSMPISDVMTKSPTTLEAGRLAVDASKILEDHKWDEMPIVDADGRLVGLIDVQDLLHLGFM